MYPMGYIEKDGPPTRQSRRARNIAHVNKIIGQLNALKRLMDSDAPCIDVATLALATRNSVNSLSVRILEGFIQNNLLEGCKHETAELKLAKVQSVLKLYR